MMINDGSKEYKVEDDNENNDDGGCEVDILDSNIPLKLRLTYHKGKQLLLESSDKKSEEYKFCAKKLGVELPLLGYLGFTAMTGAAWQNHDLIKVTTTRPVASQIFVSNDKQ